MTHFKVLYGALAQCNKDKKDFLDVYYPETTSNSVSSSD